MNLNEELFDLAERYLSGDLTEQEREQAESLKINSLEFQQYLRQIKQANDVLFLEGLNMDHTTILAAETTYLLRTRLVQVGKWLGALLLVTGVLVWLFRISDDTHTADFTPVKKDPGGDSIVAIPDSSKKELHNKVEQKNIEVQALPDESWITADDDKSSVSVPFAAVELKDSVFGNAVVENFKKVDNTLSQKDDSCKYKMKIEFQKSATCEDKNEGVIRIVQVTGGTPPYTYSIDQRKYSKSGNFSFLSADVYAVWVKDANACIAQESGIEVVSKKCTVENAHYVFSFSKGEDLKLPETTQEFVYFRVYNTAGSLVYETEVENNIPMYWSGLGQNGQRLQLGLYPFKMVSKNNDIVISGTITVID